MLISRIISFFKYNLKTDKNEIHVYDLKTLKLINKI